MNIVGLSIGLPWVLWGLLLCPLLVLFSMRSRLDATRTQKLVAVVTRVLAVVLLVLAMADARLRWYTRALAVAFVADNSASISPNETAALRGSVPQQRIERDNVRWLDVGELSPTTPGAMESVLEAQIDAALGMLPTDRIRRIVLATDGRETRGDVAAAAERARRAGAQVFVVPQGDRPAVDRVAVSGIEAPRLLRAGREQRIGVRLFSATEQRVHIDILRNGVSVAGRDVDATTGTSLHELPVEFPDQGVQELTARVTVQGDVRAENNAYRMLVRVVLPPRVLLVHEVQNGTPSLAAVYRDAHLHVDEVTAAGVPTNVNGLDRYQYVVLDELVMVSLTEPQQQAIRQWVEERGGGLLTTTGMHGVGREPTLLREIEPIMPPRAVPEPRPIELILVIDRSGSMMGPAIVNARNAGVAAVRALRRDSRVGLVAFSGSADLVVPPVPMTESEQVTQAIAGVHAGGGTDLAAALNAAARLVSNDDRYLHHVILFSDGESRPEAAVAAATALRETGATITTITLGPRSSLMQSISRIGRGNYRVTRSSSNLPALFVREVQFRNPPPVREMAFRPTLVSRMGFLDGVNPANDAPVLGFVAAQPRPGALTLMTTPDATPFLAHWFVGLGQVASLTTATSSRWADLWRTSDGFRRMFGQMAWEMLRVQNEDNLEMHVDTVPGRAEVRRISIVAPTVTNEPTPIVTLSRGRQEGVRLIVQPTAPGVWSANVALGDGFVVDARLPASLEPTAAVGAEIPYPPELRSFGADTPALAAIARAGGGRVLQRVDEVLDNVQSERVMRDLRFPLLLGALLSYLLGVIALRLSPDVLAGMKNSPKPSNDSSSAGPEPLANPS